MPSYNGNIPQPTDLISKSQAQIQTNYASIKNLIDVNHVDFSDGVNYGKHNEVQFPVQATAPTFLAGEVGLYNLLPVSPYPLTGVNELFINKQVSSGATTIPMTASVLSINASPGTFSNGYTYLPSGILLKWSQASGSGLEGNSSSSKGNITFSTGSNVPVFKGIFQVIVSQIWTTNRTSAGSSGFAVFSMSTTGFVVTWSGSNSTGSQLCYLAIGY